MTERDWNLALNGFSPLADIKDWMLPPFSDKDLEKQREAMNMNCEICSAKITKKKSVTCQKCGKTLCLIHGFSSLNPVSIQPPVYCYKCYIEEHPEEFIPEDFKPLF